MKTVTKGNNNKSSKHSHNIHIIEQLNHPPSHVAYFNNAGKVPIPNAVQKAGENALYEESNPWVQVDQQDQSSNSSTTKQVRTLFADIIGSDSSDIAITYSTGFSLTMVAHNLRTCVLGKYKKGHKTISDVSTRKGQNHGESQAESQGDQIMILQDEMSSEVYCWQEICDQPNSNCSLLIVPHPESNDNGGWTPLIIERLENDIHGRIKVVCIPQVHWSDGSYIDLKCIGEECKKRNIIFVVDATQSVGIFPINVKAIQCHVLTASVHKWLLGPHDQSLVYIHKQFHDTWLPLDQHERSRLVFQDEVYDATENNIGKHGYPEEFISGAARLDSGGKKNPILLPMVCEGLRIVKEIDVMEAQKYLTRITDRVLIGGEEIGFGVQAGPRAGHIIGLRPVSSALRDVLTPSKMVEVANRLKEKDVFLAVRCGAL